MPSEKLEKRKEVCSEKRKNGELEGLINSTAKSKEAAGSSHKIIVCRSTMVVSGVSYVSDCE